jgi:hypothetical protein
LLPLSDIAYEPASRMKSREECKAVFERDPNNLSCLGA